MFVCANMCALFVFELIGCVERNFQSNWQHSLAGGAMFKY